MAATRSSKSSGEPRSYARPEKECLSAGSPFDLPFIAWRRALMRVGRQFGNDNLSLVAGGCAFFALLAIFPAMAFIVSLYGLFAEPSDVIQLMNTISKVAPGDAVSLLERHTQDLIDAPRNGLGISLLVTFAVTVWGASRMTRSLMAALNIVYSEDEDRGFIKLNLQIVGITFGALLFAVLTLGVVAGVPPVVDALFYSSVAKTVVLIASWLVIALFIVAALTILYRMGPSRANSQWSWVVPGSLGALVLWMIASMIFSVYVSKIADFAGMYGAFGTLVVLILWMYWSFLVVLLGAELNAELEHEIAPDTTTGQAEPLGERGATMADRVAGRRNGQH